MITPTATGVAEGTQVARQNKDEGRISEMKMENSTASSLNLSSKSSSAGSRLTIKLSRDVSQKEIDIIPHRKLKKISKMRQKLEESVNSSSSFKVSLRNTSSTNSTAGGSSTILKPSSEVFLREHERKIRLIDELENPFVYQQFYEEMDQPSSSGSKLQKSSSALELNDLGRILREKRNRENCSNEDTSTSSKSSKTIGNGELTSVLKGSTDTQSVQDSFFDDEFNFGKGKKPRILDFRWINILGIFLMTAGLITAATFAIIKEVIDRNRPLKPIIYERLTDYVYPQLSAIRTSMVDPDTPKEFYQKVASDGEEWDLVFSDEFNAEGRTFYPLDDQFFEAVDIHYLATDDLEWYLPDLISTANGTLNIRLDAFKTNHLFYRSGMLQSWNKMCFTQGMVEISARLPGTFESKGFWPGLWSLGNLARPGYMASTDGVWPYTYQGCDAGITPNQSSPDGLSLLPGQRLNACTCWKEDHPNRGTGRGAPEIDIIEGTFTDKFATVAQTLQIAPFDPWWVPDYNYLQIFNKTTAYMNTYVGNSQQEAISVISTLNETWFEKVRKGNKEIKLDSQNFQTYNMEYRSDNEKHEDDYITFSTGANPSMKIYGSLLHPEGNIYWREISKEPMALVFNLGLSYSWSDIQWMTLNFPATLEIDYVRVYQPKDKHDITCDPEDYPTADYIEAHKNAYMNANLTSWENAGYKFPKNKLMNRCS